MSFNKIIFAFIFIFTSAQLFSQVIEFKETKKNFGFVHEGDTVVIEYELKNIGDKQLVITNYEVECNCTSVEKVMKPIFPGESYILKVTFDTHEKYDRQDRTVKIISNADNNPSELRFKGVVLKPKKKG